MPNARDVLVQKGDKVQQISADATVLAATEKMNRHKIGCLVVTHNGRMIGIFTERDVLQRVVGAERRPAEILIGEVMTGDVVCCRPDTDLDDVAALMKDRRVRHVPVCDSEGSLQGLISIGDVNAHHASSQEAHLLFLNEYVFGRA